MSDNMLINKIIETLEVSQNVKIWDSKNEISKETILKLKGFIKEHVELEINCHILRLFGAKND